MLKKLLSALLCFGTAIAPVTVPTPVYAETSTEKSEERIILENWAAENLTDNMTEFEKIDRIMQHVYSDYYYPTDRSVPYHWKEMVRKGYGDCWATTGLILQFCDIAGIEAWTRPANKYEGFSGHENAKVRLKNGEQYVLDAGYVRELGREYSTYRCIAEEASDWSARYNQLLYYTGAPESLGEEVTLPTNVNGMQINSICTTVEGVSTRYSIFRPAQPNVRKIVIPEGYVKMEAESFYTMSTVTDLVISASMTDMEDGSLIGLTGLENLIVSENNPKYASANGNVLTSKDGTIVYQIPNISKVIDGTVIPPTATTLAANLLSMNNIVEKIVIPPNIKKIEAGAFSNCRELKEIDFTQTSDLVIEDGAFSFDVFSSYYARPRIIRDDNNVISLGENTITAGTVLTREGSVLSQLEETDDLKIITTSDPTAQKINSAEITGLEDRYIWTGNPVTPKPIVKVGDHILLENVDYTLAYTNNTEAGTGEILIQGIGSYYGTASAEFQIIQKTEENSIENTELYYLEPSYSWTGEPIFPYYIVALNGLMLQEGRDYTVTVSNNTDPGTASITIKGIGRYMGEKTATFQIVKRANKQIIYASISGISYEYAWTGQPVQPEPVVSYENNLLVKDRDYVLTYEDNINPGLAHLTVSGIGEYAGSITYSFRIGEPAADYISMHRLYNPNSGEHFYTGADKEKDFLILQGWQYEGEGWKAPKESNNPVYRLYNPNAGDHHYTLDYRERNRLVDLGWEYESVGWYSDELETVPLYREYNPNAKTGSHNYTPNETEHNFLISAGWNDEGIAWYGLR